MRSKTPLYENLIQNIFDETSPNNLWDVFLFRILFCRSQTSAVSQNSTSNHFRFHFLNSKKKIMRKVFLSSFRVANSRMNLKKALRRGRVGRLDKYALWLAKRRSAGDCASTHWSKFRHPCRNRTAREIAENISDRFFK